MPALSFPASPTVGQTYSANGRTWSWTGYAWEFVAASSSDSRWDLFLPSAPTGLTVTAGNAQATLSWTAPTGVIAQAPIQDYTVQFKPSGGAFQTFTRAASTTASQVVTGLTNGTAYVFRVAAVNGVGVGAYSAASSSVTPAEFAPSAISGLQLWLDASDAGTLFDATSGGSLVAADGAVARWQDKSGNSRHFTQSTSGSRPLRKVSQQNGKDTLLFDGTNDFLSGGNYLDVNTGGITAFVVHKRNATGATHELLTKSDNSGLGWFFRHSSADKLSAFLQQTEGNGSSRASTNTVAASSYIVAAMWFAAGAFQSIAYSRNGTALAMANAVAEGGSGAQTPPNTTGVMLIGTQLYDGLYYNHANANIAEIIIYDTALSDANRSAVESYLMTKWGIA
jgi:hypothetical protein